MPEEPNKKLKYFQYFLRFLKVLSVLTLLLNIAACCMIMKGTVESSVSNLEKSFSFLAQAGFIVICILLVLAEFEPKWFVRVLYLFHYWVGRGLGLVWMGVECINSGNQAANAITDTTPSISPETLRVIGAVVGWVLISVGLIYVMMSVLCLRSMLGVDEGADLDVSLLGNDSGARDLESGKSGGSSSSYSTDERRDDLELIANMALALGMSEKDIRRKFAGKNGAREAQAYYGEAKKRIEQLTQLAAAAPQLPAAAAVATAAVQHQKAKYEPPTASAPPPATATAPPPTDSSPRLADDDEDLERMYYNNSAN